MYSLFIFIETECFIQIVVKKPYNMFAYTNIIITITLVIVLLEILIPND